MKGIWFQLLLIAFVFIFVCFFFITLKFLCVTQFLRLFGGGKPQVVRFIRNGVDRFDCKPVFPLCFRNDDSLRLSNSGVEEALKKSIGIIIAHIGFTGKAWT